MDLSILRDVFQQLHVWLPKIRAELALHGEPTMHPQFMEAVKIIRQTMPTASISVQTNCELWVDRSLEFIREAFANGLNALVLNCYKLGLAQYFRQLLPTLDFDWVDFYYDNPSNKSYYRYFHPGEQRIFLLADFSDVTLQHVATKRLSKRIHNSAGSSNAKALAKLANRYPLLQPLATRCGHPSRDLVLNWDGSMPLCCLDWTSQLIVGQMPTDVRHVWEGEILMCVRQLLYRKIRSFKPCCNCDSLPIRAGLLPAPPLGDVPNERLLWSVENARVKHT